MTYYHQIHSVLAFGIGGAAILVLFVPIAVFVPFLPIQLLCGVFAYLGFLMALAGIAMKAQLHFIYGKRKDGTQNPVLFVLWLPILLLEVIIIYIYRMKHDDVPVCQEVADGIFLSGFPSFNYFNPKTASISADISETIASAQICVIDCQVEVPRFFSSFRDCASYHAFPVFDSCASEAAEIEEAMVIVKRNYESGKKIFIHCLHGVGRSSTLCCAALVKCGVCKTAKEAYDKIKQIRRIVLLNDCQENNLFEWEQLFFNNEKLTASCSENIGLTDNLMKRTKLSSW